MLGRGSVLRTLLLLFVLGAAASAFAAWRRERSSGLSEPPRWPEFPPLQAVPDDSSAPAPTPPAASPSADAPPAAGRTWVDGTDADAAPDGFPVKAKESSGIYHLPGGRFYDRTKPDRWYADAGAAEADGYRPSKS